MAEEPIIENGRCFSVKEYLLYKLDRNIAIIGMIALAGLALWKGTPESTQIATAVVGGLVGYLGGRVK